jgi:glycosyltransferase involved in cell wall biosynthesis
VSAESDPLVSVIIPTRNRAESVLNALQSVFRQTYAAIEIVVVDDASEDTTPKELASLNGPFPMKILRNNMPIGAAASRNRAIRESTGIYIAGLDDDDTWEAGRISLLVKYFRAECSGVTSYDRMISDSVNRVWRKKHRITHNDLLYYNMAGNQVLTKKEYLEEVGGYDESLPAAQDYDLWIRLSDLFGPIITIPKVLQNIRVETDRERITTSEKALIGYRACLEKHKAKMNPKQIRYQEYRLRVTEKGSAGWSELLASVPLKLLKKEITRKLFL